jgi:hypothetical protein
LVRLVRMACCGLGIVDLLETGSAAGNGAHCVALPAGRTRTSGTNKATQRSDVFGQPDDRVLAAPIVLVHPRPTGTEVRVFTRPRSEGVRSVTSALSLALIQESKELAGLARRSGHHQNLQPFRTRTLSGHDRRAMIRAWLPDTGEHIGRASSTTSTRCWSNGCK